MADASLSQDEIDALLSGAEGIDAAAPEPAKAEPKKSSGGGGFGSAQKVAETMASAGASSLTAASNKITSMEVASAGPSPLKQVASEFEDETLVVKISYTQPASGTVFYLFKGEDAKKLAGLMTGGDVADLDDSALGSLQDAVTQMVQSANTQAAEDHGLSLEASDPKLSVAQGGKLTIPEGEYWAVKISLSVEDTIDSTFYQLYPTSLAKALGSSKGKSESSGGGMDSLLGGGLESGGSSINVQNAEFSPLVETAAPAMTGNINLLLDVPMEVTVELGRSTKTVQEVLSLGEGSIIELDKLAGEPVDLLVNGKPIAKGEVVVIDENFGVRVTEIVNLKSRISQEE